MSHHAPTRAHTPEESAERYDRMMQHWERTHARHKRERTRARIAVVGLVVALSASALMHHITHEAAAVAHGAQDRAKDWHHRIAENPGVSDAAVDAIVRQLQIMNATEARETRALEAGR